MNPGRELDNLVAEKVMGWKLVKDPRLEFRPCYVDKNGNCKGFPEEGNGILSFNPSTDIAAAWKVVTKIIGDDENAFDLGYDQGEINPWGACFTIFSKSQEGKIEISHYKDDDRSAPGAICHAALKTVNAV